VFWFSLQLLSDTFLVLRRIQRDITINVHRSLCKVPLLLSDFNETWIFSADFRKTLTYQISRKSVQWKQSFYTRTDGQISYQSHFAILRRRLKPAILLITSQVVVPFRAAHAHNKASVNSARPGLQNKLLATSPGGTSFVPEMVQLRLHSNAVCCCHLVAFCQTNCYTHFVSIATTVSLTRSHCVRLIYMLVLTVKLCCGSFDVSCYNLAKLSG
jgi:hypothetical protein